MVSVSISRLQISTRRRSLRYDAEDSGAGVLKGESPILVMDAFSQKATLLPGVALTAGDRAFAGEEPCVSCCLWGHPGTDCPLRQCHVALRNASCAWLQARIESFEGETQNVAVLGEMLSTPEEPALSKVETCRNCGYDGHASNDCPLYECYVAVNSAPCVWCGEAIFEDVSHITMDPMTVKNTNCMHVRCAYDRFGQASSEVCQV